MDGSVSQVQGKKGRSRDMARKKVKLQWIVNDTARRTTYKKRVKGLMKKVKELSILCGVEACAVVYSPYDPTPEVWPSPMEAVRVMGEFKCRPENDQTKKKLNQENYTRQRVAKAKDQLVKQQKKNRGMEMENLMSQCLAGGRGLQNLSIKEFSDLMWSIDDRVKEIGHKMEYFHHAATTQQPAAGGSSDQAASQKTALEVALESLEGQASIDAARKPRESGGALVACHGGGGGGGQDMMHPGLYDLYEDPVFWGPPIFP